MSKEIVEQINNFKDYLEKERGYSAHTVKSYLGDLQKFRLFLIDYSGNSDVSIESVDKKTITHFLGKEFE